MSDKFRWKKEEDLSNKPTRFFSDKQEKSVGKEIGAKQTSNSGATMFDKGDLKTNDGKWLIECKTKTSSSDSISIKKDWLKKIKQESLFMGKEYEALIFNFGPDEENYAIINMNLFQELMKYLNDEI